MKVDNPLKFNKARQAYNYAMDNQIRLDSENEKLIILLNPWYIYYYALDILNSRFELGEPKIATNAEYSFEYAKNILKSRFELGEKVISKDPFYSILYVEQVLKSEFKLGEKSIATSAEWSYRYALFLNSRFELGEEAITSQNWTLYLYLKNILGNFNPPINFLEKCSIITLEKIVNKCENKEDVIKVLFKKKILS